MKELSCLMKREVFLDILKETDFAKRKIDIAWKANAKNILFPFQNSLGNIFGILYSKIPNKVEARNIKTAIDGLTLVPFLAKK